MNQLISVAKDSESPATATIFEDTDFARHTFDRFPKEAQAPSLHPDYVCADAVRDAALIPAFFVFESHRNIFYHAVHISPIPGTSFHDLQSPYGYGGPLATTNDTIFLARAWEAYLEWCEKRRIIVEFVRFHPLLRNWQLYLGETQENRETVWIDLKIQSLLASYHSLRRRQVYRAQRNRLLLTWGSKEKFLDHFIPLYEQMLERKRSSRFYWFPHSYYEALLRYDCSTCAICWHGLVPAAAAIFLRQGCILEYHLGASSPEGQELGAMTLLLHEAALFGQRDGFGVFHLGGGTDTSQEDPLLFFKAGFSDYRGRFRIGKYIHDPEAYNQLRVDWQNRYGIVGHQVLFYRS
jgi:hypothetical protein